MNQTIKEIKAKCREENPYGYSIGIMNFDNFEENLLKRITFSGHTIKTGLKKKHAIEYNVQLKEEVKKLTELLNRSKEEYKKAPMLPKESICFLCEEPKGDNISLESRCGHNFHKGCIKLYLKRKIAEQATSFQCPICHDSISDKDAQKILDKPSYEKYEKLLLKGELMKSGINYLECPGCKNLFEYVDGGNPNPRIIACTICNHK